MPAPDQTQVIAGRNMYAYTRTWAVTNTMPADSVVFGDPPGWTVSGYDNVGYTRDGLRLRLNVERQDIIVDQVVDPVLRVPTRRNLNMETAFAQINALNLSNATGQGTITTLAPVSGTRGHTDYIVAANIIDLFITTGFDILAPGTNESVRAVGWKGLAMSDVEMQFNVTDAARIAYNIAIVPDTGTTASPISPARVLTFRQIVPALP